ncbi:MAG: hypothetical protein ACLRRJ_06960 [Clostridium sp.]
MAEPSGYPAGAQAVSEMSYRSCAFGGICAALFDRVRTGKGDL